MLGLSGSETRTHIKTVLFCARLSLTAVLRFVAVFFQHGGHEMKRQRGFTLIEMLVVVAIILIIAAVTIPSMTGAKVHAD